MPYRTLKEQLQELCPLLSDEVLELLIKYINQQMLGDAKKMN